MATPEHVGAGPGEDMVLAPWSPTQAQWGGLARAIMMALDMGCRTPREIFKHLESTGKHIPQWLRDEPEMQALDHVPSKGTRCAIIYKAMLDAARPGISPSGHAYSCDYHCDQYPHECTCGHHPDPQSKDSTHG